MTYEDVLVRILAETTGRPESHWRSAMAAVRDSKGPANLDKELTDAEAKTLMDGLRKEKSGILAWLVRGGMQTPDAADEKIQ